MVFDLHLGECDQRLSLETIYRIPAVCVVLGAAHVHIHV